MPAIPATITVPFECIDSTEGYGDDGRFRGSITFQCAWALRHTLAGQLLGSATQATVGGTILNVVLPSAHPAISGAFVKSIGSITGWPDDNPSKGLAVGMNQYPAYTFARLTVEYEIPLFGTTPPGPGGGGPRIEESIDPSAEFITLPNTHLKWATGGSTGKPLTEVEAPGYQRRKIDFLYKISGLPTLPAAVIDLMGCVNNAPVTFYTLGVTIAAEKLLYAPPTLTRYVYPGNGASAWEAAFRFGYDPKTWNRFYRASIADWDRLYLDGSVDPYLPYPLANFAPIFAVI